MKYVVFYENADDFLPKAQLHFPAHRARWEEFRVRGVLLLIGPFTDRQGAMGVFTTREAAEEFVKGDPFLLKGVVAAWNIREWNEALMKP